MESQLEISNAVSIYLSQRERSRYIYHIIAKSDFGEVRIYWSDKEDWLYISEGGKFQFICYTTSGNLFLKY